MAQISSKAQGQLTYGDFSSYAEAARKMPNLRPILADCYNRCLAPKIKTRESAFNIWATDLAYAHPLGISLDLVLRSDEQRDYGDRYFGFRRYVSGFGLSAFLFLPLSSSSSINHKEIQLFCDGRAIVLFRGTTSSPAWFVKDAYFPDQVDFEATSTDHCIPETQGWRTDFNPAGVGIDAFWHFKNQLRYWLSNEAKGREVTYIGHSLGGALSLRAQYEHSCYAKRFDFVSRSPEVFAFNPPGVDLWTQLGLNYLPADSRTVVAHPRDRVSVCGHFPRCNFSIASNKSLQDKSPDEIHILPLATLREVWSYDIEFLNRDYRPVPTKARVGEALRLVLCLVPFRRA